MCAEGAPRQAAQAFCGVGPSSAKATGTAAMASTAASAMDFKTCPSTQGTLSGRPEPTSTQRPPTARLVGGRLSLLERGHRQARVLELLPIQLGGLLVPAPHDGLTGRVDAFGEPESRVERDT